MVSLVMFSRLTRGDLNAMKNQLQPLLSFSGIAKLIRFLRF
jgi:hypothetical protein